MAKRVATKTTAKIKATPLASPDFAALEAEITYLPDSSRGIPPGMSEADAKAAVYGFSVHEALINTTALSEPVVIRLSDEQLAIADAVQNGHGNILVRARAGTGKTYLIRRCVPLMLGTIAIAAYNRKIAREISIKLFEDGQLPDNRGHRPGLSVGTFHSFGFRVLAQRLPGMRVEGNGKNKAGFLKFDVIAERLNISKPLQSLVRRAMERAQERLLEINGNRRPVAAVVTQQDTRETIQAFLDDLITVTVRDYRGMMASIANYYRSHGYMTENQQKSVSISARRAGRSMPSGLVIGQSGQPAIPVAPKIVAPKATTQASSIGSNDELDPAWFDLAKHYALELDLPSDDSIEMQMMFNEMSRDGDVSMDDVRNAMLRKCLVLAAKAIHLSARMASEKFRYKYTKRTRGGAFEVIEGEEFNGVISFSEMLYLPLYFNMAIPQFAWVCVDEAQDSNPARREFAKRMLAPNGRMMWVGDDRQAIYGWAGADNDALDQIITQFACTVYPMTVTYRCGRAIVRMAQTLVPDYKAADENPEGSFTTIDEDAFNGMDMLPTDAILCRNTAPLVKTAYKLIARGVACHVEGKDIGKQLLPLLYRWSRIKNIAPYVEKLTEYRNTQNAKLMAEKNESAAEALNDRVETILAIIAFLPKDSVVSDIQAHVEKLFSDTPDGEASENVTLMTIHRSKGLEFPRVFGFGTNKYLPSPYARQPWQQVQEDNLKYVKYTRAINEFIDVKVA